MIIAVGVNSDGRREVLGMEIGASAAETIWTEFLRKLTRRGLRGVKLVVSDAHDGLKATRRVVSAFIATAFAQETPEAARRRPDPAKVPKLAAILDDAEPDVLAYMTFPKEHRAKLHSTKPDWTARL